MDPFPLDNAAFHLLRGEAVLFRIKPVYFFGFIRTPEFSGG